ALADQQAARKAIAAEAAEQLRAGSPAPAAKAESPADAILDGLTDGAKEE
ncbi:MAG: hypothetical protein RIR62_1292, partial [Pseudomonadota bacterium]